MASFAYTDASVVLNSVDLSDYVRQVTINVSVVDLDDTAMGDTFRARIGGLKDWSVTIEFNNDFGASAVDATLWPLLGTVTTLTVKPTSGAVSATNPSFSGNVLLSQDTPLGGSVGDLAVRSATWNGSGPLTRATS